MIIIGDVTTPPPASAPSQAHAGTSLRGIREGRCPRAEQVLAFCWHRMQVDRRPWCAGGKRGASYGAQVLFSVVFVVAT